jgi:hypothetical protein
MDLHPRLRADRPCSVGIGRTRLETEEEEEIMATHVGPRTPWDGSAAAGSAALLLGTLCTFAVAFTYVLSLSDAFNPANWIRVVGLVWIPLAFAGVPIAYALAREGAGRGRGRLGVLLTVASLAALVALVIALG